MTPYSLIGYRELMAGLRDAGYDFIGYDQAISLPTVVKHQCLLRHDIDADLTAALKIARLEADLDIRATYFLMLRSPLYNLFSRHNHKIVDQIIELGHEIGLHYDRGFGDAENGRHDRLLALEVGLIEEMFGSKVHAISFHQPDHEILAGRVSTSPRVNTYDKMALASYEYFSDSNRTLRLGVPNWNTQDTQKLISELDGRSIQLLLHPMWWVYEKTSTAEVWDQAIIANFEMAQAQCLDTERAYGARRNITLSQITK